VLDARKARCHASHAARIFVPERYAGLAFADADIPLMPDSTLAPKITDALQAVPPPAGGLVVGCGTGFVPACLSAMGASIRAIEILPELAQAAQRNLKRSGFGQVEVVTGDTFNLDIGQGYALIAVCGALPQYDERFARALAVGGKLFVVVGASLPQEALMVTRTGDQTWDSKGLFETAIDPLDHAPSPERFEF
jgi:protein-L-isoaspartate(D-aspartate) O-methyltransferase